MIQHRAETKRQHVSHKTISKTSVGQTRPFSEEMRDNTSQSQPDTHNLKPLNESPAANDKTREDSEAVKNGSLYHSCHSKQSAATFKNDKLFDQSLMISPIQVVGGSMLQSETQLKLFTEEQPKQQEETKAEDKPMIDLSEIRVDEQDLTPIDMSENVLCSQDLAQLVMTQAFANVQKIESAPQPTLISAKPEIKGVLKSSNTVGHRATPGISFKGITATVHGVPTETRREPNKQAAIIEQYTDLLKQSSEREEHLLQMLKEKDRQLNQQMQTQLSHKDRQIEHLEQQLQQKDSAMQQCFLQMMTLMQSQFAVPRAPTSQMPDL